MEVPLLHERNFIMSERNTRICRAHATIMTALVRIDEEGSPLLWEIAAAMLQDTIELYQISQAAESAPVQWENPFWPTEFAPLNPEEEE